MISFLIPTHIGYHPDTIEHLNTLVNSIPSGIPGVEVFLIGNALKIPPDQRKFFSVRKPNSLDYDRKIWFIPCDGTITQKFNFGVASVCNDYVVWVRDYMRFSPDWFDHMIWDFDVCMNRILNPDGSRFRDWCSWDDPEIRPEPWIQREKWCPGGKFWPAKASLVPYSYNKTDKMYISGGYLIGKRDFLLENPMDESLNLGDGEDVEWSTRVRNKWKYVMNEKQVVWLQKQKDVILPNYENSHLYFRDT
jgi:hypothetical protein